MTTNERIEMRHEADIAGLVAVYGPTGDALNKPTKDDKEEEK